MRGKRIRVEGEDYLYEDDFVVFVWRRKKADAVWKTRKISLVHVSEAFFDQHVLPIPEESPRRGKLVGLSESRLLVVVHVAIVDDDHVRVITAWPASREEQRAYARALRPKGETDGRRTRGRDPDRDPARGRPTFLGFLRRHHPSYRPRMARLPRKGIRSRQEGALGRIQDKAWALGHAFRLATVGDRLAAVRKIAKMSQTSLARASGVDQAALSRIERGKENLGVKRAEVLAKALRVSPAGLLWGRR